jgi:hypothetical protein
MAEKFNGTFDELKQRIEKHEIVGDWDDDGNKRSFRSNDGGVLVRRDKPAGCSE